MKILYEDKNVLAVFKPAGILSQPAAEQISAKGQKSMLELADEYLTAKGQGPAGLVHRLDSGVSGIMVFGKNKKATALLSAAVTDGRMIKEYLAVADGRGDFSGTRSGTMQDFLKRDNRRGITSVVPVGTDGAKDARLEYEILADGEGDFCPAALVKIKLITGRTHQIRAQFSSRGAALLGDKKYGSVDGGCDIALIAYRLTFPLPDEKRGRKITLTHLPDEKYPWDIFSISQFL